MEQLRVVAGRYLFRRGRRVSGFVSLFISKRLIHGAATALLGVFVPIFLYKVTGEQFYILGLYYAVLSLAYVAAIAPGMQVVNRFGSRVALVFAGACSVLIYGTLYFMDEGNVWILLGPLSAVILLFRVFHWVPYHVDFTVFTKNGERGKNVSLTYATIAFMGIMGPILAGYIIQNSGYDTLFLISIVLMVAATVSYGFVPKTNERFVWGMGETWKRLFSKKNRPVSFTMFANGAESALTLIVWPIFLYELLDGNVFEIGAITTLVAAITIVIQLVLGRYIDRRKGNDKKTLRVGSTLYAFGWIIKIFVLSATQIFFVGLYHSITKIFTQTPLDAMLYDLSADQGHYVDEFTALREMSIHLGRFVCLVAVAGLTLFISIQWTFIIGAAASLALNMVYRATQGQV